jgi:hypothetical protein
MFSTSFLSTSGAFETSRYFQTKRAALNWAKWMRAQAYVERTFVYRGNVGGDLIEEAA